MANIYLRLPQYICAFYRNRDTDHPLSPEQPLQFCAFSQEYVVLSMGLRVMSESDMARNHCYSQMAWKNMLRGRTPDGKDKIIKRDAKEWPSAQEISTMAKESDNFLNECYDYLCIATPKEICDGGRFIRVNNSYSLDRSSVTRLEGMLRHEFVLCLLDWMIQDRRFCNQRGIDRPRLETLERFFMVYGIPVSADKKERESLRRMTNRWLDRANTLPNDRIDFSDRFFEHITAKEAEQISNGMKDEKLKTEV